MGQRSAAPHKLFRVPDTRIINTRGDDKGSFDATHIVGSEVVRGVPPDLAVDRALRVREIVGLASSEAVSTDAIRFILDELRDVGSGQALGTLEIEAIRSYLGQGSAKTQTSEPLATSIVSAMTLAGVRAWRLSDGTPKYDWILKNNSVHAFTSDMGVFYVVRSIFRNGNWEPAGYTSCSTLPAGATLDRKNLVLSAGADATSFGVTVEFQGAPYAAETVPFLNEEPLEYQNPVKEAARSIMSAATLDGFQARIDAQGSASYDVTIRNNTAIPFTPDMGSFRLSVAQLVHRKFSDDWEPMPDSNFVELPANGTIAMQGVAMQDEGGSELSATLHFDDVVYATETVAIQGTDERNARATQIADALTIPTFSAWVDPDGQGRFNLTLQNNTPHAFTPGMGRIVYQMLRLDNGSAPAGGWSTENVPANGVHSVVNHIVNCAGASSLEVKVFLSRINGQDTPCDSKTTNIAD